MSSRTRQRASSSHVRFERGALLAALRTLHRACPHAQWIRVSPHDGEATLVAIGGPLHAELSIACESSANDMLLPIAALSLLAAATADTALVEPEQGRVRLRSGGMNAEYAADDDYSICAPPTHPSAWSAADHGVREAINAVVHCHSNDGTRPHLAAVAIERGEGVATVVASDGYRLAWRDITLDLPSVMLPGPLVRALERVCSDADTVSIGIAENRVFVRSSSGVVLSHLLVAEQFPAWRHLVQTTTNARVVFDRDTLLSALTVTSSVEYSGRSRCVRLAISPNAASIHAISDAASVTANIDGELKGAAEVHGGINAKYLLDAIAAVRHGDRVAIDLLLDRDWIRRYVLPAENGGEMIVGTERT